MTAPRPALLLPMRPRDPRETGRVASSLELFFDLVFVVAVSIASSELHHALTHGDVLSGLGHYVTVFFAIWWAWMNFTWFATAFDTDDWLYRITTFVQMAGVLVLAAGIHAMFTENDLRIVVAGYVVMRLAMVSQWLRAARNSPEHARTARAYAIGISTVQVLWVCLLAVPPGIGAQILLVLLIAAEMLVPVAAERFETTPRHPHHVTERYNLFTLIVLGESLLASSNAVITTLQGEEAHLGSLAWIAVMVLVTTAAMWWIYFWPEHHRAVTDLRSSFRYGYLHFFVLAAAAAFSAGVEVEVDRLTAGSELSALAASFCVSVPIAIFLLATWWIVLRKQSTALPAAVVPTAAVLVLLDPVIPVPVTVIALVMVTVVVVLVRNPPIPDAAAADAQR